MTEFGAPLYLAIPGMVICAAVTFMALRYIWKTMHYVSDSDHYHFPDRYDARHYNSRFLKSVLAFFVVAACCSAFYLHYAYLAVIIIALFVIYVIFARYLFKCHTRMIDILFRTKVMTNFNVRMLLWIPYFLSVLIVAMPVPWIGHMILFVKTFKKTRSVRTSRCARCHGIKISSRREDGPLKYVHKERYSDTEEIVDKDYSGYTIRRTIKRTPYTEIYDTYIDNYKCEGCGHAWSYHHTGLLRRTEFGDTVTTIEETRMNFDN